MFPALSAGFMIQPWCSGVSDWEEHACLLLASTSPPIYLELCSGCILSPNLGSLLRWDEVADGVAVGLLCSVLAAQCRWRCNNRPGVSCLCGDAALQCWTLSSGCVCGELPSAATVNKWDRGRSPNITWTNRERVTPSPLDHERKTLYPWVASEYVLLVQWVIFDLYIWNVLNS